MAKDLLHRFIFDKIPIRGEFIHLDDTFQTIVNQHNYPKSLRHLLGEALCAAGLLSAIIKFNGRLTVQFRGKGKLKLLLAQCDSQFNLRGLAKWIDTMNYNELMESFHQGVLVFMLDSGMNKNQYQGIVSWQGQSLAESIEGYFKDSEQLDTRIWLSVNENSASGFLLQVIPEENKNLNMEKWNVNPEWERIIHQTSTLNPKDLLQADYPNLLQTLYPEDAIRIFDSFPVSFRCTCSRKKGEDAILLLGKKEAEEELNNKQSIVVTCDFCNKEYIFDRIDVAEIFANKDAQPPTHLH